MIERRNKKVRNSPIPKENHFHNMILLPFIPSIMKCSVLCNFFKIPRSQHENHLSFGFWELAGVFCLFSMYLATLGLSDYTLDLSSLLRHVGVFSIVACRIFFLVAACQIFSCSRWTLSILKKFLRISSWEEISSRVARVSDFSWEMLWRWRLQGGWTMERVDRGDG